jgi:hypothetical protein
MSNALLQFVLKSTGAKKAVKLEVVQRLWSGYGEIGRYALKGTNWDSVIVKQVQAPTQAGKNNSISHQRKVRSYQV